LYEETKKYILNHPEIFFKEGYVTKDISGLLIIKGHGKIPMRRRVAILWFIDDEKEPYLISRFCLDDSYRSSLNNEIQAYQYFLERGEHITPEAFGIYKIADKDVYFESAVTGVTLPAELFQNIIGLSHGNDTLESLVLHQFRICEKIIQMFDKCNNPANEQELVNELEELINYWNLSQSRDKHKYINHLKNEITIFFKQCQVHRRIVNFDFIPSNVILNDNVRTVVDWEHSAISVHRWIEPIRFLVYSFRHLVDFKTINATSVIDLYLILQSDHWFGKLGRNFLSNTTRISFDKSNKAALQSIFTLYLLTEYKLQQENSILGVDQDMKKLLSNIMDDTLERELLISNYLEIQKQLEQLHHDFDERTSWALKLDAELKERRAYIQKLQQEFEERTQWALRLDDENKNLREEIKKLHSIVYSKVYKILAELRILPKY